MKLLPFFHGALVAAAGVLLGCSPKVSNALTNPEMSATLPANTRYALVHMYRLNKFAGFAIGYDVRLNDSVVYRARNNSQATIRCTKSGPIVLSAKTEARSELTLDIQPGREYYVRCALGMGAVVGRPQLTQVAVAEGKQDVARVGVDVATGKSSPSN
jgi:hypothetical protein